MTDRHITTLPSDHEDAALSAALQPLFDRTGASPSQETLTRLDAHAATLTGRRRGLGVMQAVALAAMAFFAVATGSWTPAWTAPTDAMVANYDDYDDDASWLDNDELGGGFDLLVLPAHTDDPARALETVNALIDSLGDDA